MTERFPDLLNPAVDANGNPINGARLFFYRVGTSTKKNTYSESTKTTANANPVVADSSGRFPDIFMLTDEQYKVILAPAGTDDPPTSPIDTWDFVSPVLPSGLFPVLSISAKSSDYTVLTTDRGASIYVDASSGAVAITLPAAATAGSGFSLRVVKIDSSENAVTIDGDGAETIDGQTTLVLGNQYDAAGLETNGTAWFATSKRYAPDMAQIRWLI